MREGWISCAIGDVVEQVKRVQSLNDNEQYRLLGVRWYGMGAFHRETVTTASSKANKFFRVHTGDFIYNRLFAWKGAFAVIEDELDGHCVSGEFPVFRTDPERLLPEYLFHYMARPQIWDRILLESTGSTATSRNRWKEDRFLSMEIDLPPIDVQRRIVDLISSIDDAIRAGTTYKHLLQTSRSQLLAAILSSHEGWLETRLADIAFEVTDRVNPNDVADTRYVGLEHIDSGHHVLQRYGDSTDVVSHKTRFKAGDILFGKLRPYLRKSALATFDGMCSTDILVFRARPGMVMPEYLALILQTPGAFEHAERTSAGTRMPRTSARAMMGLRVLCPPLGEQRRIVDLISSIDQALSRIDTVRAKAAQLLVAATHELVGQQDSGRLVTIDEIAEVGSGVAFPHKFQGEPTGEYPFIKVSDMNAETNSRVVRSAVNWIDEPTRARLKARRWPPGTIIFPKVGAALLTEKRRMLGVPACFDNNIMGLVAGEQVLPEYLYYFMTTVRLAQYAQSGAVPSIRQSHVTSLQVMLPTRSVQQKIVDQLRAIDDVVARATVGMHVLRRFRQAVLNDLIAGNHTIPDSYDHLLEDAS